MPELFRKVLVPLDGSERAEVALSWALSVVPRMQGEVLLFCAAPGDIEGFEAGSYLNALIKKLGTTQASIRYRVEKGNAAELILKISAEEEATCIAMATHGRSGILRWLLGSVTEKVVRAADRPVVVVPARHPQAAAARIAGPIRKILVPTDGSGHSLAVLPWAEEIARSFQSELFILHVAPLAIVAMPPATLGVPYAVPGIAPTVPSPPEPVAREIAQQHSGDGLRIIPIDTQGDAASEIVRCAGARNADLVAISTHGRTGSARWMLGSVAEKVVRALEVPALVVRPEGLSPTVTPPP